MLPLGQVIHNSNISFHIHADDTQIYLSINPSDITSLTSLTTCLASIRSWMSNNFLMLNNDKTEVMVFGPRAHRDSISKTLVSQGLQCTHEARNLGVIFDSDLNFSKHFTKITKSAITEIRNIAKIRSFLSFSDAQILIHAFVSSHLDYCNSLFVRLLLKSINRLQLVQNTTARVL